MSGSPPPPPTGTPANSLELLPKLPVLDNTFGAVLIGTFISLILYGLTLHQLYRYYILYPSDKLWLRWTVSVTVVLETVHMALCCHVCYWYLVSNYFNPFQLQFGSWSTKVVLILSMDLLGGELAFFAAATIETFIIPTFKGFQHLEWMISVGSAQAITADTLLTSVLIVTLRRRRTGIQRTDSMIDVLILYAVSTGFLTTVFNLLAFIFILAFPGNLIYIAFSVIVTKLYANTLFVALNTRHSLSKGDLVEDSEMKLYGSSTVVGSTIISPRQVALRQLGHDQLEDQVSGSAETMGSNISVLEIKVDDGGGCAHQSS
ncbi:hypothetical protein V8D89_001611 [Ganoderma adspersum]